MRIEVLGSSAGGGLPQFNCNCDNCKGEICGKIWTTSSLVDICIKVDDIILGYLEDLILGTLFILNMNSTLEKHRIK